MSEIDGFALVESTGTNTQKKKLQPATRALHILLAEDQPVNQCLAVRMLEKRGHSDVVAGDGREGRGPNANVGTLGVRLASTGARETKKLQPGPNLPAFPMLGRTRLRINTLEQ